MSDNGQPICGDREVAVTPRGLREYHAPGMEAFGEVSELTQALPRDVQRTFPDGQSFPNAYTSST